MHALLGTVILLPANRQTLKVQRRVLRIVWPDLRYREAINRAGLERLVMRREKLVLETLELFREPGHVL